MSKFIYVFSKKDAKQCAREGHELLKHDEENDIWVFANKDPDNMTFSPSYQCVLSNVLSF